MLPGSPGWQLHPAHGWAREGDRSAGGDRHNSAPRHPAGRSVPVLGGHRRLLKLACPIPTSPGHSECQAWRGLGTASLPAPRAIFGADPLSWMQTCRSWEGRAGTGTGVILRDDTRACDNRKLGRGAERSCWSRGGGGEGNVAGYGTGTPLPTPQPERCLTAGPI